VLENCNDFLLSQFFAAENYTGIPGEFVPLEKTLVGVQNIVEGQCDRLALNKHFI
jgi:F0F1-type ATP synthase beta subunit